MRLIDILLHLIPWSFRSHIKRIPGVAEAQRFLISKFLDGKEFDHRVDAGPARGIAFHVRMPEDKGIWTGTYEVAFSTKIAKSLRPGMVAYDIGSWHGFYAGVMAARGARVVHVFEPLPANLSRIRKLVELNPEKRIVPHAIAVGERESQMDLLVMPDTSMAKLEVSEFQPGKQCLDRVQVPVRSIDQLVACGECEPPSIIKIDVEGAEMHVLRGARETLRAHRPEIFAEIHSPELLTECRHFLEGIGYSMTVLEADQSGHSDVGVVKIRALSKPSPMSSRRLVSITFDDGFEGAANTAIPILARRGFSATFYLVTGWVEPARARVAERYNVGRSHGSWDFWRNVSALGHEVGSHSFSHLNARGKKAALFPWLVGRDVATSLDDLKRNVPASGYTISMPWNAATPVSETAVLRSFSGCRLGSGKVAYNDLANLSPHRLHSWAPSSTPTWQEFTSAIDGIPPNGWLILQFHSFEGEGWESTPVELFARICDYISERGIEVRTVREVVHGARNEHDDPPAG